MNKRFARIAVIVIALLIAAAGCAYALSANVVMKVSRTAQDSVINVGEDLTIDIALDGVEPARYMWYFEDELIDGADDKAYTIIRATVDDAGMYRMDAYGDDGAMLVSMEFAVRVIEEKLPQAGDNTLGIGAVAGIMGAAATAMGVAIKRSRIKA